MLQSFQKHDIIPPMVRNFCLEDPRTITKFNDTLQTRFVKHDIYHKIHHIYNQTSCPLPTYLARAFEMLDKLITCLMHAEGTNAEDNNSSG